MSVKTITFSHGIQARIVQDEEPTSPAEWDNVGEIAYCSSRETLGTENVSPERLDEISAGIRSGKLIGLPVYAYVHSGATIRCAPFTCPWDSGQSGFVYATREKVLAEFGKKRITAKVKAKALACLESQVKTFDRYLTGDVYGVIIERVGDDDEAEELNSCWGFYGLEYAKEEAKHMAEYEVSEAIKEAIEVKACAERDIATVL